MNGKCWACGVEGPLGDDGNCEVVDGCLVRQRETIRAQLAKTRIERDAALETVKRVDALVAELTAHPVIRALVALEEARKWHGDPPNPRIAPCSCECVPRCLSGKREVLGPNQLGPRRYRVECEDCGGLGLEAPNEEEALAQWAKEGPVTWSR